VPTLIRCFCAVDPIDVFHESDGVVCPTVATFVAVEGSVAFAQLNESVVLAALLFTGSLSPSMASRVMDVMF
jgi:hypothetical protein